MDYADFAARWGAKLRDRTAHGRLATFMPNKALPIHNWFYYKEGFARDLVVELLDRLNVHGPVLDPFCGVGTTLLACKEKGISSIGIDAMPLAVFAAMVKTREYDIPSLEAAAKALLKKKFTRMNADASPLMRKAFNKYALDDIAFFRREIAAIDDPAARDFMLLALLNAATKCSYARKDGAALKIRKAHVPPVRVMLRRVVYTMLRDLKHHPLPTANVIVAQGDARFLKLPSRSVAAVITSPPYLNNIDYTKVYALEEHILGMKEKPAMRSYLGALRETDNDLGLELPLAAVPYFADMRRALAEMQRTTIEHAPIAIVVGNGYFPELGTIIDSDLVIAWLAEQRGMAVEKIEVLNERFALERRTQKKGVLRESLIILRS